VKSQVAIKKPSKERFKFVSDIIAELRKVTWPSRGEALRLTSLVIAFTVAIAIILGVIDYGFSKLMNVIFFK
jgi:preprotein translocase subunit SecE